MPVSLSQVISVALSLAVVYYVMGLLVSAMTKFVLEALDVRGKSLEDFLKKALLGGIGQAQSELLEELKKMPEIDSLKPVRYVKGKLGFPVGFFTRKTEIINYVERIPPKNLVDALFSLKEAPEATKQKVEQFKNILPERLKTFLNAEADKAEAMRANMETWFTGMMEQAAQHYKAQARWWVILFSFVVTFVLGVDSIALAKLYWKNAALAATADAQAALILQSANEENQENLKPGALGKMLAEMQASDIGWYQPSKDAPEDWSFWDELLKRLPGMLVTTLAVSQGSSFWYDIIKQIKGEQTKTEPPAVSQ